MSKPDKKRSFPYFPSILYGHSLVVKILSGGRKRENVFYESFPVSTRVCLPDVEGQLNPALHEDLNICQSKRNRLLSEGSVVLEVWSVCVWQARFRDFSLAAHYVEFQNEISEVKSTFQVHFRLSFFFFFLFGHKTLQIKVLLIKL